MKKIITLLLALLLLATVTTTLSACGEDKSAPSKDSGSADTSDKNDGGESAEEAVSIENDFPAIIENNPNGHTILYDDEYMYFTSGRQKYTMNGGNGGYELCRMKKGGGEKESLADMDAIHFKDGDIYLHDGYIYLRNSGRLDRVNAKTGEVEEGFIDIEPAPDKENNKNNVEYTGYSTIQNVYFIGNILLYNYQKGNKGTSELDQFSSEYYNFDTGETIKLEMDIRANTLGYDEEHLYMFDNNTGNVTIIPLSEFKAGKTNPAGTEVKIGRDTKVSYIASNGFVIKEDKKSLAFYQFKDALALSEGGQWEPAKVLAETIDYSSVFYDDHNKTHLYLSDDGGFGYGGGTAYRFDSEFKPVESLELVDSFRCGVVDGTLYLLGFDDNGVFQAQTITK